MLSWSPAFSRRPPPTGPCRTAQQGVTRGALGSAMEVTPLQLQTAWGILSETLNRGVDDHRGWLINEIERHTGCTLRTPEQEAALRALVRFADVECDQGIAEVVSLGDGPLWLHARFLERREASRVPLLPNELYSYLSRAHENSGADAECLPLQLAVGNPQGWPPGPAIVFLWEGEERRPELIQLLDVLDIKWVRATHTERPAIIGFLGGGQGARTADIAPTPPAPTTTLLCVHASSTATFLPTHTIATQPVQPATSL